jgi:hypothetical protein
MKPLTLSRLVPVLALGAFTALTAITGCQTSPENSVAAPLSSNLESHLGVRNDSACTALGAQLDTGEVSDSLRGIFISTCVIDVTPDHELYCEWTQAQIDSGRTDLVRPFKEHCAIVCDSLMADTSDTSAFDLYCRPQPPPACEVLKANLARADSGSRLHANMLRQVAHVCSLPHPKPVRSGCDSLEARLALLDSGSAEYAALLARVEMCRGDTVRPAPQGPKPDSVRPAPQGPKPDSLRPEPQEPKPDSLLPEPQGPKPDSVLPEPQGPKPDSLRPEPQGPKPDSLKPGNGPKPK